MESGQHISLVKVSSPKGVMQARLPISGDIKGCALSKLISRCLDAKSQQLEKATVYRYEPFLPKARIQHASGKGVVANFIYHKKGIYSLSARLEKL